MIASIVLLGLYGGPSHQGAYALDESIKVQAAKPTEIHLITQYIDGVSIQQIEKKHIISVNDYLNQHPKWKVLENNNSTLILKRTVKDLSPVSKSVGVLGLKDGNTLTLFKGDPKANQIIQTFFQIDVDALQVNLIKQLKNGIPVSDKQHYTKMIHSFSRYALHYTPIKNRGDR
ncbi:forespore regulator of the sigma-K checkpoint [Pullulanibacillus pueri]|nr:forespore regulator of the sigma-K checkpoint [Pullulanibacillus pueri]